MKDFLVLLFVFCLVVQFKYTLLNQLIQVMRRFFFFFF